MVQLAYTYEPTFSDKLSMLLDRVDYRLAECQDDRDAIFRLRYEAYRREQAIDECSSEMFRDEYDEKGRVKLFGVYLDDRLVSSVRIHIASPDRPYCPSLGPFQDVLEPELEAGKVIVDSTRFVTDKVASQEHKGLPHLALRLCWMAVTYFEADHFLAAVRAEHQAFYRRTFQHKVICPARTYPLLAAPICLMSVSHADARRHLLRRNPFYRSSGFERRMLFGTSPASLGAQERPQKHLRLVDTNQRMLLTAQT